MNQYETAAIKSEFTSAGYNTIPFSSYTEICIINSCCVTDKSEKQSMQAARKAKRINPNCITLLCGCVSEKNKDKFIEADIVTGNKKTGLPKLVTSFINEKKQQIYFTDNNEQNFHGLDFGDKTRAFVKIEDGCENYCAYCIIPHVRGAIRSKKADDIINEMLYLINKGYKEIVLTGIHITSYGRDFENNYLLIDLLEEISQKSMPKRLRLGSLEPGYLTQDIIPRLKKIKGLCPHFHISLQSGSDNILKSMNRKYNVYDYKKETDLLREYFENCAITTDIIIGFPGESDNDFTQTLETVKLIGFTKVHIFPFSKRDGTAAYLMENQIDKKNKENRCEILKIATDTIREEILNGYIDTISSVLIEKNTGDNIFEGFCENYIKIYTESDKNIEKQIVRVKIKKIYKDGLLGEIIL